MASKKKKQEVDNVKQSEDFIAFMRRALASENFKAKAASDPKKKKEYEKMEKRLEKEKLILKFLKMDTK